MGITIDEVVFRGDAPSAPTIAKMVEDISGLPLVLNDFGSEIRGSLFDLHARLAFARYPRCRVNLTAYRAGAVGEHVKQCVMDGLPIGITNAVEGANEAPGTQTVYVEGYTEERTIVGVTLLALEALGGRLREPISAAERQVYGRPIAPAELDRRHRKNRWKALGAVAVVFASLPVLALIWFIWFGWFLATLPWRLWKICREFRRLESTGHSWR